MAPRRGTRDEVTRAPAGVFFAAGRMVGFLAAAGTAVALIAAIVLVPALARLAQARYERGCQEALTADLEALAKAQERMIEALPEDETLAIRLLISQEDVTPSDREPYELPSLGPSKAPDLIEAVRHPRPAPPPDWLVHLDRRLKKPATRRGLLLLAVGALVAALFLFAPPEKYRRRRAGKES